MGDDIAGIIHGVMPAVGAPAVYRRFVAGSIEGDGLKDIAAGLVLGKDTTHVTAVLGSSQGGMELLPSKEYLIRKKGYEPSPKWLSLIGGDEKGTSHVVTLPNSNPYKDIYKAHNVWWEMAKDEYLNPLRRKYVDITPRENFESLIDLVQKFHISIANHYHNNTYVHFGADGSQKTFGSLNWNLDRPLIGLDGNQLKTLPRANPKELLPVISEHNKKVYEKAKSITDKEKLKEYYRENIMNENGQRFIKLKSGSFGKFTISRNKNEIGDGTVPFHSGVSPLYSGSSGVKQVFQMTGFDHQGSYGNQHVRRNVLYSIVKIIKDSNIQPRH